MTKEDEHTNKTDKEKDLRQVNSSIFTAIFCKDSEIDRKIRGTVERGADSTSRSCSSSAKTQTTSIRVDKGIC